MRWPLLLRHMAVPLAWAAFASALELAAVGGVGPDLVSLRQWAWTCLPWIAIVRIAALYVFDVHLPTTRGIELPTLVPWLAIGLTYLTIGFIVFRVKHPTVSVLPLLATSAVTSVVLGIALQPVLANLFAGIVVSLERPFRLGDYVRIGNAEGRVSAINWHSTHLRTADSDEVIIANAKLSEQPILNLYYPHPMHLARVRVGTDLEHAPYRVRQVLVDCAAGARGLLDKPSPDAELVEFAPDCAVYELRGWVEDAADTVRVANALRGRIWEAFRRNRYRLTFPGSVARLSSAMPPAAKRDGARLFALDGAVRGRSFDLAEATAVIGRSEQCQVRLSGAEVSSEHARVERTDGGWMVVDLGSKFGSRVNGAAIARHPLADLDRITIGDTTLIFEAPDGR